MVRDAVANVVERLREKGFEPRRVGSDAWEARCPAHRSSDRALAITRDQFNHVALECRGTQKCPHTRIVGALGITNDHVYAETPDWVITRLGRVPIQPALFAGAGAGEAPAAAPGGGLAISPPEGGAPAEAANALDDGTQVAVHVEETVGPREAPGASGSHQSVAIAATRDEPVRTHVLSIGGAESAIAATSENEPGSSWDASAENRMSDEVVAKRVRDGLARLLADGQRSFDRQATVMSVNGPTGFPSWQALAPVLVSLADGAALSQQFAEGALAIAGSKRAARAEGSTDLERPNAMRALSRLTSTARLFRSADGRYCAQVEVGDRLEIYGLRSSGFRDWVIDGFLKDEPEPPSGWAIRRVIGMLEAKARFTAGIPEVFVRVGWEAGGGRDVESTYFLDLGDSTGRAVAIRDDGWSLVARPNVHFRRPEGLLPLPVPALDGSIDLLRQYVNLTEPDFRLMIAWLTAALRPVGPYPVLVLNGEQASGKSTLARILRMLIDPQACPVLALPGSTRDLMATALNGWMIVYENITTLAGWFSDCVCQLAFGGGIASRTLFTNDERSVIYAQRPMMLVGIDDFVQRGDLRDRSVFLNLRAIRGSDRRSERSFWPAFQADYPRILGGVLDAIAGGMRELPSVHLKDLPRMADYAEWGEATGRALGWGAGSFLSAYHENRKRATEPLLDDSPVATMVFALARLGANWTGTMQKLYNSITMTRGVPIGPKFPKDVSSFGAELRRIAPQLRVHGIALSFGRTEQGRTVTVSSVDYKKGDSPSDA
jgi:hypothetical protein